MKKIFNIFTIAIIAASMGLSSCVKKFDASSYAPLLNINGFTASSQIAPSNLVAYWGFNGSLADSLSGTKGTAVGTSFTSGLLGQALQGADNGYVLSNTPDAIKQLHSFTVSVWVNMPENTAGAVGLLSIANNQAGGPGYWGSLDIFFNNGATPTIGQLEVHAFNVTASPTGEDVFLGNYSVNNSFGAWVNVSLTYDDTSSTFVLYYNGSSIATSVAAGFAPLNWTAASQMVFGTLQFQTTPSLTISTGAPGWASFLTGSLDEVRFYNRVLTSTEVSSLVALQHRGK
jgi:hypothetical protein